MGGIQAPRAARRIFGSRSVVHTTKYSQPFLSESLRSDIHIAQGNGHRLEMQLLG